MDFCTLGSFPFAWSFLNSWLADGLEELTLASSCMATWQFLFFEVLFGASLAEESMSFPNCECEEDATAVDFLKVFLAFVPLNTA